MTHLDLELGHCVLISKGIITGRLHGTIVLPTSRSDDRIVFDRSDRRSEESKMFDFVRLPIQLSKRVDTTSDWSDRPASRTTNRAASRRYLLLTS